METDTDTLATSPMQLTEVGLIPEDWKAVPLSNVGVFAKGRSIPKSELRLDGVPCVLYGDIYTKYHFSVSRIIAFIPKMIADSSFQIKKGDILFAGSGETAEEIGKCFTYIGDQDVVAGGDIIILRPKSGFDSTFLSYLLNSSAANKQKSHMGQGSSVYHIYASNLRKLQIPLPPTKAEQTAIATALGDADALIESLEQLIAKKRLIKQGAMQELLTPPGLNHGLNGLGDDTDGGGEAQQAIRAIRQSVPIGGSDNWEVKTLGEVADIVGGGTPSSFNLTFWNGEINWFTPTEVGESKYIYESKRKITQEGYSNSSTKLLPVGTVLLTSRAGIGDLGILMKEGCTNQGFQSLIAKEYTDNEFLYYLMTTLKNVLIQNASGSTFLEISPGKLRQIEVAIPEQSRQQEIAQILSDMDAEIERLEAQLAKWRRVKEGMMQCLLTGQRRLIVGITD